MKTKVKATLYIATICAYALGFSLPCYAANDSIKTNLPATPSKQYVAGTLIPIAITNGDFSTLTTECRAQADTHCPDINNKYPPNASEANCPSVCYVRRLLQITTADGKTTTYPDTYPATSPAGPNNPITNITVTHPAICPAGYVAEAMYNPDWDIETLPNPQVLPYPIPDFKTLDNYVMSGYSCTLVASTAPFQATDCFQNIPNTNYAKFTYYPTFVGRAIPFDGNCPSSPSTRNDYYKYVYCNYNNSDPVAYANADTVVLNLAAYQSNTIYQVFANNGVGMFTDIGAKYYNGGYSAIGPCNSTYGTGNHGMTDVANVTNPCYMTYTQTYDAVDEFVNYSAGVACTNKSQVSYGTIAKPIFAYYQCTKPAGTQFADYKIPTYVACARVTPIWHIKGQPYFNREPATPDLKSISPTQ